MKRKHNIIRWIDRLSQYAVRVIVILCIVIVLIQALLQYKPFRALIVPTEQWEGTPVSAHAFATLHRL